MVTGESALSAVCENVKNINLSAQAAGPRIGAETGKLPRSFACGSQPQSAPLGFSANPGIGFSLQTFRFLLKAGNIELHRKL